MPNVSIEELAALAALVLLTILVVALYLVVSLIRGLERQNTALLQRLSTLGTTTQSAHAAHDHSHIEDVKSLPPALQFGQRVEFADLPAGQWVVVLGLSGDCHNCLQVKETLPNVVDRLTSYALVAIVDRQPVAGEFPDAVRVVVRPDLIENAPFVLMADDEAVIQGAAHIHDVAELLEFVSEGHAVGFGPGLQEPVEVPVASI